MGNSPSVVDAMVKEAMAEVAKRGWQEAHQNAVTLTAYGMMVQRVEKKIDRIVKPAWLIAISISGAALWWIISSILGLG